MDKTNNNHKQTTALLEKASTTELVKTEQIANPEVTEVSPKAPRKQQRFAFILAGLGLGAIALGAVGNNYLQYASSHEGTDNATVVGHIHQISSRIPGNVIQVLVNDNQLVRKGQLLVKLDPQDYQVKVLAARAALENAQSQAAAANANISLASQTTSGKTTQAQGDVSGSIAAISTAKAAVKEAEAGIPSAQADVQSAKAGVSSAQSQVVQAEANLAKTALDYRRYRDLYRTGAIARQQLDNAKTANDVAIAQKNSAIEGVEQAKAKLASSKVEVAQAQAKLLEAQENVVTGYISQTEPVSRSQSSDRPSSG
jgi:membrane fusion protein (multidrug efflux system)